MANCQIDNLPPVENTTERIAKENNVSPSFVIRAEQFIPYMTKDYPAAFLLGSEYRNDMNSMAEKLETVGAHYVLVDPFAENGIAQPHCFVAAERVDPVAEEAFKKLIGFLKERILYKEH